MSMTNKVAYWFVAVGVILASTLVGNTARAGTIIDNIKDPSYPQFSNSVTVRANRGSWTISGNRDFSFSTDENTTWNGTGNYKLTASFDSAGNFESGTVSISGKLPDLYSGHVNGLVTADVTDFGWDGGSIIGFNTNNIVCSPLLGVNCTLSESVLVYLDNPFGGDVNARLKTSGVAVTSVPLPAALALMVSGLGLLGGAARRRSSKQ